MVNAIIFIAYLFAPALIIFVLNKIPIFKRTSAIIICYILGLIIGNLKLLPEGSNEILEIVSFFAILIALPLTLFTMKIKNWGAMAKTTFAALITGMFSVMVFVTIGFFIFRDKIDEPWKIAGMLTGVYTGGTPNLAAISKGLKVDNSVYILVHSFDLIFSALFLLFLITVGKKVLRRFLPKYAGMQKNIEVEGVENYHELVKKKNFPSLLLVFGLAILSLGAGLVLYLISPEKIAMAVTILMVTTMGIVLSLVPKINKTKYSFDLGMYFILVFSFAVASMADIREIIENFSNIAWYVGMAVFGSLLFHIFLAKLFRIDADTTIAASTALICSPLFVPVVAGAMKNKQVVISGFTIGIIGFALGNYLGISVAYLLKNLF